MWQVVCVLHCFTFAPRGARMADDTYTGCRVLDGRELWYKDGELHRDDDLPAEIWEGGTIVRWYRHGYIHRDGDLPAEVYSENRIQIWRQFDQTHREHDKPAWISGENKFWFWRGKQHREGDRPAVVNADGSLEWWVHGVRQIPADRRATQQAMRWSDCRADFVGACAVAAETAPKT